MSVPNPHRQRGQLLYEQQRFDLAEKELRQALGESPDDAGVHALLALCLARLERLPEAEREANQAVHLAPDASFSHYVLASVLQDRLDFDRALEAVAEAIRLEPADPDHHALQASLNYQRRDWTAALASAEQALQFDPEHVPANNVRAMALTQLGRRDEAGATLESTLARAPEDPWAHANLGWTLLHGGRTKEAVASFREALRLDPTNDHARAGLVEGLKAGNPLYALMLRYFLFVGRLSGRAQWMLLFGGYLGNRLLGGLAEKEPALEPWIMPVRAVYLVFVLLTWLAMPVFNLLLLLHPVGRHALEEEPRRQARWTGACLGMAVLTFVLWLSLERGQGRGWVPAAWLALSIPVSAVWTCAAAWARKAMAVYAGLAGAFVVAGTGLVVAGGRDLLQLGAALAIVGMAASVIGQWVALGLQQVRARR